MIEVNEDVQLATNRREQEIHRSEEAYHRAVAEGRIVVKTLEGTNGRLVVQHNALLPSIPPRERPETEAMGSETSKQSLEANWSSSADIVMWPTNPCICWVNGLSI